MSRPPDIERTQTTNQSLNHALLQIAVPILIMLMVGSLIFFLIEVFYRGPHGLRLAWVLGLFTIASVLVSRISIEEGLERASIFGFALAAATLYVTVTLVDFEYGALFVLEPVVVSLLIAVVMWCSNRLTWDCTVIDASRDVSAIGLAELVKRKWLDRSQDSKPRSEAPPDSEKKLESAASAKSGFLFWFFASNKRQNSPGLWVFYFALAAFPIFGFGQWFSSPDDVWGYRWIFMLFAVYLGSSLGLLMVTSLLNLERYLHKRGAAMPAGISRNWLALGTAIAAMVMVVMLFMPSLSLSNGLQDALGILTTNNPDTSKHAIGKDGDQQGENPRRQVQDQNANDGKPVGGDKGQGQGDQGQGGDSKSQAKGNDSSQDRQSNQQSESAKKSNSTDQPGDRSNEKSSGNDANRKPQNNESERNSEKKSGAENPNDQPQKKDPDQNKNRKDVQGQAEPDAQPANRQARNQGADQNAQPRRSPNSSSPSRMARFVATIIKYVVYIIGLIALLIVIWMFRDELVKLWNQLFGKQEPTKKERANASVRSEPTVRHLPFSDYDDPFISGFADNWPAAHTLEYTFQALEAWGRDHSLPREPDWTPHEFSRQLVSIDTNVASEARRLADLFGESLFSEEEVEWESVAQLRKIWQLMIANAPTPPVANDRSNLPSLTH